MSGNLHTHAILRVRRSGSEAQNTLFIVNYNKEDIEYYYKTLRYLERLDDMSDEEDGETDEVENQEDIDNHTHTDTNTEAITTLQNNHQPAIDGAIGLAMVVGGFLGMYSLIFLIWLARRSGEGDDGEL